MKTRSLIAIALTFAFTTVALAQTPQPRTRTFIVKDGKLISGNDGDVLEIDGAMLGGRRAYLGVSLVDITDNLRQYYGAPTDAGILVGDVEDNGPADKAGFRVGDIVLSIDGKEVSSSIELRRALRDKKEGDTARVEVLRGRNRQTLVATLAEKEGPGLLMPEDLDELRTRLGTREWRARLDRAPDCTDLQSRIKELETRLKDLEKKLQK
jgi:membrane-associated protease RseP (regulator of RpoE activity)